MSNRIKFKGVRGVISESRDLQISPVPVIRRLCRIAQSES